MISTYMLEKLLEKLSQEVLIGLLALPLIKTVFDGVRWAWNRFMSQPKIDEKQNIELRKLALGQDQIKAELVIMKSDIANFKEKEINPINKSLDKNELRSDYQEESLARMENQIKDLYEGINQKFDSFQSKLEESHSKLIDLIIAKTEYDPIYTRKHNP